MGLSSSSQSLSSAGGSSSEAPENQLARRSDWEIHGKKALAIYREKFPDRYVENYTMLAKVIRLEADVKHSLATPKTIDEALAQLESKVGKKGRQKFEKFLRELGELDDEDDVIDVESE